MNREHFVKEYHEIVARAFEMSEKARGEGLLAMEEFIDEGKYKQRDIMELGLRLVVDGIDKEMVNTILTNIVNQETDNEMKILKTIKKEAVLSIQAGYNPLVMALLLNSFVDIENDYALEQYKEWEIKRKNGVFWRNTIL